MIENFEKDYEVCNCRKVTLDNIVQALKNKNAKTLRDIQDITSAGTDCRHCIFPEGDFGKIKKKIYCKDILNEFNKSEGING